MENRESTYSSFWQDNLEKIALVHKDVDRNLMQLEKEYVNFEGIYRELEENLDLLSSLYAGINTIDGMEYIHKMRSLVQSYRKRYTLECIDFDTLNFLTEKIDLLRDLSFEDFPVLDHVEDKKREIPKPEISDYSDRPFKWTSFSRNNSWYLTSFNSLSIIDAATVSYILKEESNCIEITVNKKTYSAIDIFGEFTSPPRNPRFFLMINNEHYFAADTLGKRIFAKKDLISPKVTGFKMISGSNLFSGRVRIFGRQHLYIHRQ